MAGNKLPDGERRRMLSVKLHPATIEWLRTQPEGVTKTIDRLIAEERVRTQDRAEKK